MVDVVVVVGARPNFMKAAPIVESLRAREIPCAVVHTGQHYDRELSEVFFEELELPAPDLALAVGSGSHAAQTARIMLAFERALAQLRPRLVVVVGDVNSTLACGLVAAKQGIDVAHVEAGLRCFDFFMPEEINRRLCDHLSSYLFATSRDAVENLRREGIDDGRIVFVGNTMIDTLLRFRDAALRRDAPRRFGVAAREYALLTLHRAATVDDEEALRGVVDAVVHVSRRIPVLWPLHPRTGERLARSGLDALLAGARGVQVCPPLGYLDFLGLVADARLVLTDSGGVQEETTVLGVSCLTLRPSTERPVTVTAGTNRVVGTDRETIVREAWAALDGPQRPAAVPDLWDGRAGERVAAVLEGVLLGGLAVGAAAHW